MATTEFKAESKRLMDLMIHSIYTNKEIFLRELISNASDAQDKLAYLSLTEGELSVSRENQVIRLIPDKEARTLTLIDSGIGMNREELENNLGTIAKSGSLQFKEEMDKDKAEEIDVIGQFGVGFYSGFMVADEVIVTSRKYGSEETFVWKSSGTEGYEIETSSEMGDVGTKIVMHIKENTDSDEYDEFLEEYRLQGLVKKYSDYIRYPIMMEMDSSKMETVTDPESGEEKQEWVTAREDKTLNSMTPIWQKPKSKVTPEEYHSFYQDKFGDWKEPLTTIHTSVEGSVTYKALLYIPSEAPYNFYTREFEKGLQLYSSGVLIMEKCAELIPDHFRFIKGVVDSQDFSLNISREMLQQTRELSVISSNLEKKIKNELVKFLKDDREKYEGFFKAFGAQLKFGVVAEYGNHKEMIRDLLLYWSSKEDKNVTFNEYVERMPEDQKYIYYACGKNMAQISKLPQVERLLNKGYEVLYCYEDVDDFVMKGMGSVGEKLIKSVYDEDALPQTEEEKKEQEEKTEADKDVLEKVKEALGDKIVAVRISTMLTSGTVVLSTQGSVSLEMEKYMSKLEGANGKMQAERVLEFNPESPAYGKLKEVVSSGDEEKLKKYAKLFYGQALILADLPLEDPAEFVALTAELMA